MNILGHYYLSIEIIISVSFFCEIGFSFLPTASSVCDLIAGSHTFCYRAQSYLSRTRICYLGPEFAVSDPKLDFYLNNALLFKKN